ncbi:hypothetical protein TREES_T100012063 [Tupaia chinensis]|uniref:Uncharacterized protein n=1 Tax=Tupaia chinensis TaxID=246437 RepID=L9KA67_TUPCH|nr:hypothetical protein TREES_T100012063 [Tupaia chinensis]
MRVPTGTQVSTETAALSSAVQADASQCQKGRLAVSRRQVSRDSGGESEESPAGLDDSVSAWALSSQVKLQLKTAAETRLAKQKDVQTKEAGLLPFPRAYRAGAILSRLTLLICASYWRLPFPGRWTDGGEEEVGVGMKERRGDRRMESKE